MTLWLRARLLFWGALLGVAHAYLAHLRRRRAALPRCDCVRCVMRHRPGSLAHLAAADTVLGVALKWQPPEGRQ